MYNVWKNNVCYTVVYEDEHGQIAAIDANDTLHLFKTGDVRKDVRIEIPSKYWAFNSLIITTANRARYKDEPLYSVGINEEDSFLFAESDLLKLADEIYAHIA